MDFHPTPYPVRSKYMNPKPTRKVPEVAPNLNCKNKASLREKRVFGTARNPNISSKPAPENPAKPFLKKAEKPSQATPSPPPALPPPPVTEAKNSSEKNITRSMKKSVCFRENESSEKALPEGNGVEPQTPARSPNVVAKPRRSSTPYHTADKCSKCRFDKLETSAYWLGQIKLAESVGKHSVSAAFFGQAFECKAEPIRNIRIGLKKYLGQHEYLNGEHMWKRLAVNFGLVKEEIGVSEGNFEAREGEGIADVEHEDKDDDVQKQTAEESEH